MLRKSDYDFQSLGRVIAVRGESKIFHRFSHAALLRGSDLLRGRPARDLAFELREGLPKPGASPSGFHTRRQSRLHAVPTEGRTGRKRGDSARRECRSRQLEIRLVDRKNTRRPQNLRSAIERVTIGRTTILTTPLHCRPKSPPARRRSQPRFRPRFDGLGRGLMTLEGRKHR
jgi:hypothetical protein